MSSRDSEPMKASRSFVHAVAKKLKCIRLKGGRCKECNMDLVLRPWLAHFHHREPSKKSLGIMAALGSAYGLSAVKDELEKCDLLCGHCHAGKHFAIDMFLQAHNEIKACEDSLTFDSHFVQAEDIKKIVELAASGLTIKEIAKQTGLATVTCRKHVPSLKFGNDLSRKITDDCLIAELTRGLTLRDIAEKYSMGYKTVWKRWKRINGKSAALV